MLSRSPYLIYTLIALTIGSASVIAASPIVSSDENLSISQTVVQTAKQRRRGTHKNDLMEQLNLSEDQKSRISAIRQKYKENIEQLRRNIETAQQELQSLMTGNASNEQIRTQYQQVTQLRQELHNLHFESMLEMREVLTPEQRNQLSQLIQQRREKFRGRFDNQKGER